MDDTMDDTYGNASTSTGSASTGSTSPDKFDDVFDAFKHDMTSANFRAAVLSAITEDEPAPEQSPEPELEQSPEPAPELLLPDDLTQL